MTQVNRGDPVGDIAYDIKGDEDFPIAETRLAELIAYVESKTGDDVLLSAFRRAR
ncbi:sterile alpha motif-like domain-containing protein [Burkholderia vietnamiensis]|nr:sterile alpha motif-like domain-containing protein [Burkholderia vietnamiensis]